MAPASFLAPTQRYAAAALFAVAVHQAQIHQTLPLGFIPDDDSSNERISSGSSGSDSVSEDPDLWAHENSGLLRPVFRFLDIDSSAWNGLEETAGSSPAKHHVGAFLRLLSEETGDSSSEMLEQEQALSKAIDAMVQSMETTIAYSNKKEKHREYENECREKCSISEVQSSVEEGKVRSKNLEDKDSNVSANRDPPRESGSKFDEKRVKEVNAQSSTEGNVHSKTLEDKDSNVTGNRDPPRESGSKFDEKPIKEITLHSGLEEGNERVKTLQDKGSIVTGNRVPSRESGSKFDEKPIKEVTLQSSLEEGNERLKTLEGKDNIVSGSRDPSYKSGSEFEERPVEEVMLLSYQRKVTVLYELLSACLADASEDKKKYARRRNGYDARHRVALRLLATWLDIKWIQMEAIETMVACSAMTIAKKEESKEEESRSSESKWAKWKRGGIIGAAALTGGTLMAITGGLAAPAIAAGFGALAPTLGTLIPVIGASGFAAAASVAGTVAGSVAVAASFGAAGAGLTGSKVARRIGSVDEFEFKPIGENHNQGRLAVEILVSGLVFNEEDFVMPWEGLIDNLERYAIQWESKNLTAVSTAIQDWLTSSIAMELMRQGAMLTVLSTLIMALAWPATLLAATNFIDSKWTIAVDRSDKAGKLLAEVLQKGLQGNRPVTLVGYSLGARMIYKCLQALAETEHSAEIVERVVLLGAPIPIKDENWEAARRMVAGRFVNAYSTTDWTLGVAFRASLLTQGLAGIQPINVPGIENVDVTDLVEGHSSYLWASQKILDRLELDTYYPVFRSAVNKEKA